MVGGALIGGLAQILMRQYLKKYPELLDILDKHKPDTIPESGKPHLWKILRKLRGGGLISISVTAVSIAVTLSAYGSWIGVGSGLALFLKSLTRNELFNFLYNASPQNFKLTGLIATESLDLSLGICTDELKYLFNVLSNESISFEEKERATYVILTKYIDLKTHSGRVGTGVQLLQTATPLFIRIPVVGGVFFGSLERVFHGTIFGGVCAVGRDAILVPIFIVETFYNHMLVGPVLGRFGIVAPLNFTSYLRFGEGIRAAEHPGVKAVVLEGLHKVGNFLKNLK